jgi:hypothetical protein
VITTPGAGTMMSSLLLLLFLLPLLVSGVRFGGGARLGGNGDYEDWRLGTATYIKESQGHPLNDGMRPVFLLISPSCSQHQE